jgi:hypothetical protein
MKPVSVADPVVYWPEHWLSHDEGLAAMCAGLNEDGTVNLAYFTHQGFHGCAQAVPYIATPSDRADEMTPCCCPAGTKPAAKKAKHEKAEEPPKHKRGW